MEKKDFEKVQLIPDEFTVVAFAELPAAACISSSAATVAAAPFPPLFSLYFLK